MDPKENNLVEIRLEVAVSSSSSISKLLCFRWLFLICLIPDHEFCFDNAVTSAVLHDFPYRCLILHPFDPHLNLFFPDRTLKYKFCSISLSFYIHLDFSGMVLDT